MVAQLLRCRLDRGVVCSVLTTPRQHQDAPVDLILLGDEDQSFQLWLLDITRGSFSRQLSGFAPYA